MLSIQELQCKLQYILRIPHFVVCKLQYTYIYLPVFLSPLFHPKMSFCFLEVLFDRNYNETLAYCHLYRSSIWLLEGRFFSLLHQSPKLSSSTCPSSPCPDNCCHRESYCIPLRSCFYMRHKHDQWWLQF